MKGLIRMNDLNVVDEITTSILRRESMENINKVHGVYTVECHDKNGNLKWKETFDNLVTDVGARFLLDTAFGGSANSTYFLGLTTGTPTVNNADTMTSKGWTEATGWSTPSSNARATITWSAASGRAKAIASAASFTASGALTVGGCFIVTGSGAVATNGSTAGTLYSVGAFSGGNKVLALNDTLQVSYSTSA
jgi:hypothetical protein